MKNVNTKEVIYIWGRTERDALNRNPSVDPKEWDCIRVEYID